MEKQKLLWQGKTKDLYATEDPDVLLMHFKDHAIGMGGLLRGEVRGKGKVNNCLCALLMNKLQKAGVATQLIRQVNDEDSLIRRAKLIPLEVIVRNYAAGSLTTRLGLPLGTRLGSMVLEFNYKSDELDDPLVNEYHIMTMGWASAAELDEIDRIADRTNTVLTRMFAEAGLDLIDFKLEFGRMPDGSLILVNEISCDTCRLWDPVTRMNLDRDSFGMQNIDASAAYQEVARRMLPNWAELLPDEDDSDTDF